MTLRHKTRFNTSGQGFKKDPIRYQCFVSWPTVFSFEVACSLIFIIAQ